MSENIKTIMEGLGENEFILPVGYKDREGTVHRTVKLAPMTGETEEAISDPKVRDNAGKIITALLAGVVIELGTVPRVTKEIIKDLATVDRDFLLFKNREVSLGNEVEFTDACTECRAKNDVKVDLSSLETVYMENEDDRELSFELPNGYLDANNTLHKDIVITLPTGRVQERVTQIVRSNPAQATTAMLQLITKRLGTLDFIKPEVFKKMTKKDRDFISKKLAEKGLGVDYEIDAYCSECGSQFTTSIPMQSLLGE